ncbi:MAG: PilZ domain-containing protein [Thermoanaerobaculia bacterium]|nr:PilZ domain-containing protein [Thermoanaerobaculia bacterium]
MPSIGQRRHKRYEVHDVHGALLFRTTVQVKNLSVSGLALETAERLQLGRTYAIRLAGDGDAVDVSGTIRWCHLASSRPKDGGEPRAVYEAGLAFEEIFTEKARGLLGFLEHHVVLSPHERLTGRFRAEALRPAELEARYEFEVLRLSLGGMLVRTSLEASLGDVYGLELLLRDGLVSLDGRVAYSQRGDAVKGEVATQLGMEFLEMSEEARRSVAGFIAAELERPDGGRPAAD